MFGFTGEHSFRGAQVSRSSLPFYSSMVLFGACGAHYQHDTRIREERNDTERIRYRTRFNDELETLTQKRKTSVCVWAGILYWILNGNLQKKKIQCDMGVRKLNINTLMHTRHNHFQNDISTLCACFSVKFGRCVVIAREEEIERAE